ncbi:MAG TPA: RsmD family RNA methyltransferase [Candidatus Saccharimonadales bacterium]|nr:RsmD family RNA methyltransferase [Candidatus Saccharimonadales bacterium]
MRVISGYLGGRQFDAPKSFRTHPMSEKARGGLFSALGDIEGLTVLDAFAGSGALSFEAISRGAEHAIAIDIDKSAINTVVNSTKKLGINTKIKAIRANSSGWSDNNPSLKFDLIFCDPPFDEIKINLIQKLAGHLKDKGVFVLNLPGSFQPFELMGLSIVKTKDYGDNQLVFYKKIS